jgi:hypothetical protein
MTLTLNMRRAFFKLLFEIGNLDLNSMRLLDNGILLTRTIVFTDSQASFQLQCQEMRHGTIDALLLFRLSLSVTFRLRIRFGLFVLDPFVKLVSRQSKGLAERGRKAKFDGGRHGAVLLEKSMVL